MKSGNLNFLELSGSLQVCNGTALAFYMPPCLSPIPLGSQCNCNHFLYKKLPTNCKLQHNTVCNWSFMCTVLDCTVLYCTIPYCTVPYCTLQFCVLLQATPPPLLLCNTSTFKLDLFHFKMEAGCSFRTPKVVNGVTNQKTKINNPPFQIFLLVPSHLHSSPFQRNPNAWKKYIYYYKHSKS